MKAKQWKRNLVIFEDTPLKNHINWEVSTRFLSIYIVAGNFILKNNHILLNYSPVLLPYPKKVSGTTQKALFFLRIQTRVTLKPVKNLVVIDFSVSESSRVELYVVSNQQQRQRRQIRQHVRLVTWPSSWRVHPHKSNFFYRNGLRSALGSSEVCQTRGGELSRKKRRQNYVWFDRSTMLRLSPTYGVTACFGGFCRRNFNE